MLNESHAQAEQSDIVHFHVDLLQHALSQDLAHTCLMTPHGRLDLPDFMLVLQNFYEMPLDEQAQSA